MQFTKQTMDWGTGEPLTVKFDPTLVKSPTFLLRNQPIEQPYRENNLKLSDLRANDQLLPNALEENLLEKQIVHKYPTTHPMSSQISQKALFPDFVTPEDFNKGQEALKTSILSGKTPAQANDITVVRKTSGNPWRHEIRHERLPTKQEGVWFNDKQYYQYPKPDQSQTFYPYPPNMLAPNRSLRSPEHQLDARTANVVANKESELMQSTNQVDFYVDGLGTRAPFNSDDFNEKCAHFAVTGQIVQDKMKPYFRRGDGVSLDTAAQPDEDMTEYELRSSPNHSVLPSNQTVLTKLEQDEIRLEKGKEYKNFPQLQYRDNLKMPTYKGLCRSKTMVALKNNVNAQVEKPKSTNKLSEEKACLDAEHKTRIQQLEMRRRQADLDRVRPEENMRVLRHEHAALDKQSERGNHRSACPTLLAQCMPQYVQTLYDQTGVYLGERAELYRQPSAYDVRLLAQHVALTKVNDRAPPYTYANVNISSELDGRPVRFGDRVLHSYTDEVRRPLEKMLTEPNSNAHPVVQEDGFVMQQTTYGSSYNTKKYLQENVAVSKEPLVYEKIPKQELDEQDIVLKNKMTNQNKIPDGYPRIYGPIPPEPYEELYCSKDISEMSDGYLKRSQLRVYASPNVVAPRTERYQILASDVNAMRAFEAEQLRKAHDRDSRARLSQSARLHAAARQAVTHRHRLADHVAVVEPNELKGGPLTSMNAQSYQWYRYNITEKCPPNEYFKNIEYSSNENERVQQQQKKPVDLVQLQDSWSKTLAHRRFNSAFKNRSVDLRLPGGKKKAAFKG